MLLKSLLAVSLFSTAVLAGHGDDYHHHNGKLITLPPRPSFTGTKRIPDAHHPFKAPGHGDQRGPCPGLNTLANHGYIPRNGVASYEQIIDGVAEGFNMDRTLAAALTAFGMLARGNPYVNLLSIGGPTELIPPLPGKIDGNITRGIATHGRFEGDVSMTRDDAAIGDNRNFQQHLFNIWLKTIDQHGDVDKATGKRNIVNPKVMAVLKEQRYVDDKAQNANMKYDIGRFVLSYGETGFTLEMFANGTTKLLSRETLTSIFRDQRFPENWHRRNGPATFEIVGNTTGLVLAATPETVIPGSNDGKGNFIPDASAADPCSFQKQVIEDSIPGVLVKTTGLLKKNVDFLLTQLNTVFISPDCPAALPKGPAGV